MPIRRLFLAAAFIAAVSPAVAGDTAEKTILPATNASICAAEGSTVQLPAAAAPDTVEQVADCTPDADANPRLLKRPTTVLASTDGTIIGAPSYVITITGQSVGFRKTAAGPWKPF